MRPVESFVLVSCRFILWPEPAALSWARGVNSSVSGLLFALCVSAVSCFATSLLVQRRLLVLFPIHCRMLIMPAHWRLPLCPDRRLTVFSPVCLTTVGTRADSSLSAWAVHRCFGWKWLIVLTKARDFLLELSISFWARTRKFVALYSCLFCS